MSEIEPTQVLESFELASGKQINFRYIDVADAPDLLRYINALSGEDTHILFSGEQLTLEQETEFVNRSVEGWKSGDKVTVIVECDEKIVGIAAIERDTKNLARSRHVGNLGISLSPEFRNQGIGKRLLSRVLGESRKLPDIKLVKLAVFSENVAGIALYEKLGFKEVGRLPKEIKYKDRYDDEVLMVLELEEGFLAT